jgi:hypothetical protein
MKDDNSITKQKLNQYILYINDNVNELKLNHRKDVLQMIMGSEIDDDKIVEKGNGTQIKFSDIDSELIQSIYNFIYNKLESSTRLI